MKKLGVLCLLLIILTTNIYSQNLSGKKVLFLNSYHQGDNWSDGIEKGIRDVISKSGADLKVFQMDTKRKKTEDDKLKAALAAKSVIESYKPDVVIASDDNASKYVIQKFYKNAKIPFVFCGVNWDASVYGFPYSNVTGMVEVSLTKQLIDNMAKYAKGKRIAFLSADTASEHKNADNYKKVLGINFSQTVFVKTFAEWKTAFKKLQTSSDMIVFQTNSGIANWNEDVAKKYVNDNIKVMVGTVNGWMIDYSIIGIIKVAEEQGTWSAKAALDILGGKKPSDIPIVKNKQGGLYVNTKLAERIKVKLDRKLVTNAEVLIK